MCKSDSEASYQARGVLRGRGESFVEGSRETGGADERRGGARVGWRRGREQQRWALGGAREARTGRRPAGPPALHRGSHVLLVECARARERGRPGCCLEPCVTPGLLRRHRRAQAQSQVVCLARVHVRLQVRAVPAYEGSSTAPTRHSTSLLLRIWWSSYMLSPNKFLHEFHWQSLIQYFTLLYGLRLTHSSI